MSARTHVLDALREWDALGCEMPTLPPTADLFHVPADELASTFQSRLEGLSGEVVRVKDRAAAKSELALLTAGKTSLVDGTERLTSIVGTLTIATQMDNAAAETIDVGITGADALIARTGSVTLSSAHGGRRLSVLPPTHVVIAWTSQIVPTLSDASMLPETGSCQTLISGPSRTADIEKILVLGERMWVEFEYDDWEVE